jgi:tRNA pseudouridine38-40 synthase
MARFKLTLEYAGTRYSGWQIQKNARTVQGELNRSLADALGDARLETYGSGRTDAGVHALGQVAHLDTVVTLPPATLLARVNDALPADINVLDVSRVPARFHARHSAVARSYLYQIATRRTAFAKPYVWWIRDPIDVDAMRAGAARLARFADFRAFTDDDPEEKSTTVLVDRIEIATMGSLVLVRVVGSHFLWKMVRRMVGVLAEAGRGRLSPDDVERMLGASTESAARVAAPASGLFLERVFYDEALALDPPAPALIAGASIAS